MVGDCVIDLPHLFASAPVSLGRKVSAEDEAQLRGKRNDNLQGTKREQPTSRVMPGLRWRLLDVIQNGKQVKVHIFEFAASLPLEGFGADFLEDLPLLRREVKESRLGALRKSCPVLLRCRVEHEHGHGNGDYRQYPDAVALHMKVHADIPCRGKGRSFG